MSRDSSLNLLVSVILIFGLLFILRLLYCVTFPTKPLPPSKNKQLCTLIVLGSGGHTSEMLTTIKNLNRSIYKPMHYIAANTDPRSLQRAKDTCSDDDVDNVYFHSISRSREVHQSWISTVFTTFYSFIESFVLLLTRIKPDIIICNGPGTCIPVLISGLLLRVLFIKPNIKLVFLESFCRVDDLSMSGKIAYPIVNLFVVQWPQLIDKYPKAKYIGRIF